MKILTGEEYTKARLAGIMHEMLVEYTGKIPPSTNVTQYLHGSIVDVDGAYGLVVDENSEYYNYLPDVHKDRLIEYVVEEGEQ